MDVISEIANNLSASGHAIKILDIGGGLGIQYKDEEEGDPKILMAGVKNRLEGKGYKIILEPGRSIVGSAGILVTRIEYIKNAGGKKFAIIDAGMNDLIRPSLYEAWHEVKELENREISVSYTHLTLPTIYSV